MIRPRTLIISPLLSIGTVGALLIGAALYIGNQQLDAAAERFDDTYETHGTAELEPERMPCHQEVSTLTVEQFPRHFTGGFLWDGESEVNRQDVGLDVHSVGQVDELIVATGRGTYNTTYRNVDFSFRIEANPASGEFVMWESEPNVAANFITAGRHEATFDDSLDLVRARWVGDDGNRGSLTLRAVKSSTRIGSLDPDKAEIAARALSTRMHLEAGVQLEFRFIGNRANCVRNDTDRVTVHYSGWNDAGEFDNSWNRGTPATFKPNQVIPGWTQALHQMCAGDFARVFIPADQAYGSEVRHGRPHGDLTFDIEVIDVALW